MSSQGGELAAVTATVLRERQSRDRGWWDDMGACFAEDAVVVMSWFHGPATEFVAQTRQRSSRGVWGRHRLGPPVARVRGDRAWVELPVGIEFDLDLDGVPAVLVSYCRSQYRMRRDSESWRIQRITAVYERDTLAPVLPNTRLLVDPAAVADFRSSYRFLAWYFDRLGTPLPADLPGDDRPADVATTYQAEWTWLSEAAEDG